MLAYVFWHWPFRETEQDRYESSLFDFHRSLVDRKPDGFHESYVFRLMDTPWPIFDSERPELGDFGREVIDFVEVGLAPRTRRDAKLLTRTAALN
jgi:hypothetical protein